MATNSLTREEQIKLLEQILIDLETSALELEQTIDDMKKD